MKKRRLLSFVLAMLCVISAGAVGVGDYVYTPSGRYQLTAPTNIDLSINSDFSGWSSISDDALPDIFTVVDGYVSATEAAKTKGLYKSFTVDNNDKTYVLVFNAKANEDARAYSFTPRFLGSVQDYIAHLNVYATESGEYVNTATAEGTVSAQADLGLGFQLTSEYRTYATAFTNGGSDKTWFIEMSQLLGGISVGNIHVFEAQQVFDNRFVQNKIDYINAIKNVYDWDGMQKTPEEQNIWDGFKGLSEELEDMADNTTVDDGVAKIEEVDGRIADFVAAFFDDYAEDNGIRLEDGARVSMGTGSVAGWATTTRWWHTNGAADLYWGNFAYTYQNSNTITQTKYLPAGSYVFAADAFMDAMAKKGTINNHSFGYYSPDTRSAVCRGQLTLSILDGSDPEFVGQTIALDNQTYQTGVVAFTIPESQEDEYTFQISGIDTYDGIIGMGGNGNLSNLRIYHKAHAGESVAGEEIDGIYYFFKNKKKAAYIVAGETKYSGDITIPETVIYNGETYNVTSIVSSAFNGCSNLTSISIPNSVTSIGEGAFNGCDALTKVVLDNNTLVSKGYSEDSSLKDIFGNQVTEYIIGENIKSIGSNAFNGCIGLTSISIPNSVTSIGEGAFNGCNALTKVEINSNAVLTINFLKDIFGNQVTEYLIGESVTSIGSLAFYGCLNLTNITIPNSVTSIGGRAFEGCSQLTSINIPDGVTAIEEQTFYGCKGLTAIDIPNSMKTIGNLAFRECSGLTSITIPNSVTSIGEQAFLGCSSLTSINIPDGVTAIENDAFNGCFSLTSINIPNGVTSIGNDAFNGCKGLTIIEIPNSVKSIGGSAFHDCTGLISINIPDGVTEIKYETFFGCSDLTSIDIPNSVTSIGVNAFGHCSSLTSATIGNSVKSIGGSAFGYSGLTSITIPNSVTSIGEAAFMGCSGITSVNIPNSVTAISNSVFLGCHRLTSVTIPNSVTSIGNAAFGQCPFTSITIPSSVTSIGREAFQYCQSLKEVCISDLAAWCNISFAGNNVFDGVEGFILSINGTLLQGQITIPDGITKVRANSFQKVKDVYSFVIPSTVQTIEDNTFNPNYITEVIINTDNVVSLASTSAFTNKTAIYVNDDLISDYREANQWSDIKNQIYVKGGYQLTVELEATPNSPALLTALTAWEQTNSEYKIEGLADLKIKGTLNGWDILMIRNKMPNLRNLDLGESTILDNDGGMEYYTGYHTIAGTISPYMFYEVDNLRSIVLPEDITYIGEKAFGSSGLQRVSIPGTVKEIGYSAFSQCYGLISLELNKGLETINREAFYLCYSLREISLPSTLKRINQYAFCMCSSLKEIVFSEGLEEIEGSAFEGCPQLNNLHLPTSLKIIGEYSFKGCSNLTEVHVPSMITEIGDYAFKDCGLKSVYAYTVVPIQINQNTFDYDGVDLYAPANSFYAYYLNTQWSQFLNVKEFDALYTNWYMPKNTDLEINTDKPIQSEDEEIAADGDMNPGSGLIITGDGEQEVNELVMDCENGESYPSVIENNNLNVEELTFKMDVRPGRWYFFSFPFDVVLKNIKYTGKSVWRYYDGQTRAANGVGGWKNTVGELLKANQGYIFQCNAAGVLEIPIPNPEFSNSPEKEVPLQSIEAKNPQDASWNFIGNPNLSYYGIDDMAEKFDAPITVWNDEQQTYTAVVPGDDEYHFHPFEAFFVQTPENVDNMTFEDENRVTYSQAKKKGESGARSAIRSGRSVNEKRMLVNLTVSNGQTTDKTRIIFNDDNKLTYETGRDANKFMSMADVPQIYTIDAQNVKYSVNARPNDNRQVRLGFVASSDGEYTIEAERMDCSMVLKDNQTGTIHQLDGKPYTFYSEAGTFDNRFTLMSGMNITSISVNGLDGIDGLNVAAMDGGIVVTGANDGDLNVYNANGVKAATLQGSGTINLNNGTYIVTYAGKSAKIAVK